MLECFRTIDVSDGDRPGFGVGARRVRRLTGLIVERADERAAFAGALEYHDGAAAAVRIDDVPAIVRGNVVWKNDAWERAGRGIVALILALVTKQVSRIKFADVDAASDGVRPGTPVQRHRDDRSQR